MPDPTTITAPTRFERDPDRVALVVPGGGYSPARPLLHFARSVLLQHGWTVQELWWRVPADLPQNPITEVTEDWVHDQVTAAVEAEGGACRFIVGESLGTLAAGVAAERDLPALWLTPLLHNAHVLEELGRSRAATFLVGGTADNHWDSDAARRLPHEVLELPDANHALELFGDAAASVELLRRVTEGMDRFIGKL